MVYQYFGYTIEDLKTLLELIRENEIQREEYGVIMDELKQVENLIKEIKLLIKSKSAGVEIIEETIEETRRFYRESTLQDEIKEIRRELADIEKRLNRIEDMLKYS